MDVIARLAKQEKLCPQFHLSLQSGCNATLRRMNRHYTADEYRTIVQNLRASFANCAITTDIMVGFPGETEEEFAESLAFAKEIGFAKAHVFAYSRRPGTKANDAPDQITQRVKEERSRRMIAATQQTKAAFFQAQLGRVETVLFEQEVAPHVYDGYTANYTPVKVSSAKDLRGKILPVLLRETDGNNCYGTVQENI